MSAALPLTDQQAAVLAYIEMRKEEGVCPSHQEIASQFGFRSTFAVREHLRLMAQKGVVICLPKKSRAIRVTRSRKEAGIPCLGSIPAGSLSEAVAHAGEVLQIAPEHFGGGQLFALRVEGESMINAGILDGDLAVLRYQPTVENGKIAAVQIDHEATLKRIFFTPEGLILRAENPEVPDYCVAPDERREVIIGGLYVGLVRTR